MPTATKSLTRTGATSDLGALLRSIDRDLVSEPRDGLASMVNWSGAESVPIHRWYRYREGFSPSLIEALNLGDRILDPYCGCGSIMVGAAQSKRSSVGIDINPLASFVARVKLSPLSTPDLKTVRNFYHSFRKSAPRCEPSPTPELRIANKVFEPRIRNILLRLHASIMSVKSEAARDFLLLAWLSVLQDVGSYFKEGNGIKYRNKRRIKSGYETRTDGEWQLKRFGSDQAAFVLDTFANRLCEMIGDTKEWAGGAWHDQKIVDGSATTHISSLDSQEFDSIIFSPPYANRFDYFESMKVELWFGQFVTSYDEMNRLRKRSMRSHLGAALNNQPPQRTDVSDLVCLMDPNSYAMKSRVPSLLHGYFDDMRQTLAACRGVLKPGGSCFVVVGNSAYAGVIIPTDSIIAQIGLDVGFEGAEVIPVRHLTVSPQQRNELDGYEPHMRESVVKLW